MKRRESLIGKKYNRLIVVKDLPDHVQPSGSKVRMVLYLCDCEENHPVRLSHLKGGITKSCGCLSREVHSKLFTKHGKTDTKLYKQYLCRRIYD